jgi:hypothetical protein
LPCWPLKKNLFEKGKEKTPIPKNYPFGEEKK